MESEKNLIKLVRENNPKKDFSSAVKYKINELKGENFAKSKIILIKIILLLYSNEEIELGPYLSPYKSKIINLIYNGYKNPLQSIHLFHELYNFEKYGIILRFLNEVEELREEEMYDFFQILTKEKNIKDILEKYIFKKIDKKLPFNMKINNPDELIQLIDKSACCMNNKYNYIIFYDYIIAEDERKKIELQQKKIEKKDRVNGLPKYEKEKRNEQLIILPPKEEEKANEAISLNKNTEMKNEKININLGINMKAEGLSPLMQYLKERKQYFMKKEYNTPILDKIIDEELDITENLFLLKKPKEDYLLKPHYINLKKIIKIFNDPDEFEQRVLKDKNYGYICYRKLIKNEFEYREGIFAQLENNVLYSEIANKNKFEKEDIENSNKIIEDNCFKARGLSLEYYINGIFMDLLNQKELPRVIYNFDQNILLEKNDYYNDLSNIIKFNNNEKEDENYIEEHYDKEKTNKNEIHNENNMDIDKNDNNQKENNPHTISIEEFDGIFYWNKPLKNYLEINLNELPFIIDDILEIQSKKFCFTAENSKFISLKKKTLLLFEVKNRFPEDDKLVNEIQISLSKSMTFYHLYEERFPDIQKLRIMFFYSVIPKKNYENILVETIEKFFGENAIKNKIQIQFIFITSSYLAYNFKTLKDDLKNIKDELGSLKRKYQDLENKFKLYIDNHYNTDENNKGNGKNTSSKNDNNIF